MWFDESGIDEFLQRDYARARRGKQVISNTYGKKFARRSIISAWHRSEKKMVAPYVFEGYTDAKRFNGWLEKCLVPELKKGQVIVMDNASFHKSKETKTLIESAGCRLLYQPPYSPDLNPIEQQWAILKREFRNIKDQFKTFDDGIDAAFNIFK